LLVQRRSVPSPPAVLRLPLAARRRSAALVRLPALVRVHLVPVPA